MSEFNQQKYQADWDKKNMATITGKYKKDFVTQFKNACRELNIKQSDVFRQAMQQVIDKAKKQ